MTREFSLVTYQASSVVNPRNSQIFKEFLHRFLPDFMRLFFPAEAARLDFSTLTFLDQELRINLPEQTLRVPDFVAEVSTLDGEREAILVHIEIEGRNQRSLPQRMFEYYSLLRILRQKKVLPLALMLQPQASHQPVFHRLPEKF
ncbi:MAG TPA: hypothetical protein PLD25_06135 [Chloroflexota bacterium]|nr:hypothetical protein [Chloroflexota bacterium]